MITTLPAWYRGWADTVVLLRAAKTSDEVFVRDAQVLGYLSALSMAGLITIKERARMAEAARNAFHQVLINLIPTHKRNT